MNHVAVVHRNCVVKFFVPVAFRDINQGEQGRRKGDEALLLAARRSHALFFSTAALFCCFGRTVGERTPSACCRR